MTHTYKTKAIIIKRINLGEADRIVTALSRDFGKIRFVAKGVRRIKSKLSGSIEPYYESELLLFTGKNLDILSNASILKTFIPNKPELVTLKTANYFGEIIDRLTPDQEKDPELFDIFETSLNLLSDSIFAKLYFESRFYQHSGVFPETNLCVKCQKKPDSFFFSTYANGSICESCRYAFADAVPVTQKALRFWQQIAFCQDPQNIDLTDKIVYKEIVALSDGYIKNLTQHRFKSNLI